MGMTEGYGETERASGGTGRDSSFEMPTAEGHPFFIGDVVIVPEDGTKAEIVGFHRSTNTVVRGSSSRMAVLQRQDRTKERVYIRDLTERNPRLVEATAGLMARIAGRAGGDPPRSDRQVTETGSPFALLDSVRESPGVQGVIVGFRRSDHPSGVGESGRMAVVAVPDGTVSERYVHSLVTLNPAYADGMAGTYLDALAAQNPAHANEAASEKPMKAATRTDGAGTKDRMEVVAARRDAAGAAMVAVHRSLTGSPDACDMDDAGTCLWHTVVTLRDWAKARGANVVDVVADAMAFEDDEAKETDWPGRKAARNDVANPGWRTLKHPNGAPVYAKNGTLLNENGSRSIFDDVDE